MTDACREVEDAQALGTGDERLAARIAAHLARCTACQTRTADHARLAEALRVEPAPVDEVTRARWLAQLAPTIDDLATRNARGRAPRRLWIPLSAAVAAAAVIAIWVAGRSEAPAPAPSVVVIAPVPASLEVLRPYVACGMPNDAAATTLLAGRFSALEVGAGELLRVSADGGTRLALVGHARVTVLAVEPELELELTAGTLLIETARKIHVHGAGFDVRAQDATFAVDTGSAPVIFVDRATIELGSTRVHAGEWWGPIAGRSAALVASLRDHAHAIAAPGDHSGTIAIDGPPAAATTESGAVLGTTPLWARVTAGPFVVVVAGATEQRSAIEVVERAVTRVPRAAAITASATIPVAPPRAPEPARTPVPPAPIPEPAAPSASQLYTDAEHALGGGDRAGAEQILTRLLAQFPGSPQASSALYDLAGLARARGDLAAARASLDQLLRSSSVTALREPAAYLRCRLDVDAKLDAAPCFRAFRHDFATSAHDAEVLAWLVGHASGSDCAAARALAGEYLKRYPDGAFASHAREAATCK